MSLIFIETLPEDQKRRLWRGIKILNPNLAALLKNDTAFAEFKSRCNGELLMEDVEMQKYIEAGQ